MLFSTSALLRARKNGLQGLPQAMRAILSTGKSWVLGGRKRLNGRRVTHVFP